MIEDILAVAQLINCYSLADGIMNEHLRSAAQRQANVCSVFANPNRIMIFWALAEGKRFVGDIASFAAISMPSASQHLRLMRSAGLLETRRDGQTIYYRLIRSGNPRGCPLLFDAHRQQLQNQ